jgi:hypothetical protein
MTFVVFVIVCCCYCLVCHRWLLYGIMCVMTNVLVRGKLDKDSSTAVGRSALAIPALGLQDRVFFFFVKTKRMIYWLVSLVIHWSMFFTSQNLRIHSSIQGLYNHNIYPILFYSTLSPLPIRWLEKQKGRTGTMYETYRIVSCRVSTMQRLPCR